MNGKAVGRTIAVDHILGHSFYLQIEHFNRLSVNTIMLRVKPLSLLAPLAVRRHLLL